MIKVRMCSTESLELAVHSRVKSSCPFTPALFNNAIDLTVGNTVRGCASVRPSPSLSITWLGVADEFDALGNYLTATKVLIDQITTYAAKAGFQVDKEK